MSPPVFTAFFRSLNSKVRTGDASLAAPFTSKKPSIAAVVDVVRQGRYETVASFVLIGCWSQAHRSNFTRRSVEEILLSWAWWFLVGLVGWASLTIRRLIDAERVTTDCAFSRGLSGLYEGLWSLSHNRLNGAGQSRRSGGVLFARLLPR